MTLAHELVHHHRSSRAPVHLNPSEKFFSISTAVDASEVRTSFGALALESEHFSPADFGP